ncbi:3-phosphoserine phosphatase [Artemisia annua]|uniref:3-phosphoserine phosphatase n=1 Tax=Artemisia annua TaxID=35608 RepID=A0A2U1KNB8_ARTAN|nr:3-phosphoserine phosphatase [Artemisia annua]
MSRAAIAVTEKRLSATTATDSGLQLTLKIFLGDLKVSLIFIKPTPVEQQMRLRKRDQKQLSNYMSLLQFGIGTFCCGSCCREYKKVTGDGAEVPFEKALADILDHFKPSLAGNQDFLEKRPSRLSPGINDLVQKLNERGKNAYLISGPIAMDPSVVLFAQFYCRLKVNPNDCLQDCKNGKDTSYKTFCKFEKRLGNVSVAFRRRIRSHHVPKRERQPKWRFGASVQVADSPSQGYEWPQS